MACFVVPSGKLPSRCCTPFERGFSCRTLEESVLCWPWWPCWPASPSVWPVELRRPTMPRAKWPPGPRRTLTPPAPNWPPGITCGNAPRGFSSEAPRAARADRAGSASARAATPIRSPPDITCVVARRDSSIASASRLPPDITCVAVHRGSLIALASRLPPGITCVAVLHDSSIAPASRSLPGIICVAARRDSSIAPSPDRTI